MIAFPASVRVWLAVGRTDMRRRMTGLALQVQEALGRDPHAGDLYVFRGARGDLIKVLWHDGIRMSLYAKRLEKGHFVADSVDCDQPFRPIVITCHGDQNHAVHHARRMRGGRLWWLLVVATDG